MAINWPPTRREASTTSGESQKSISTKNGNTGHRRETAWEWGGSYYPVRKSWDLSWGLSHHDSSCNNINSSIRSHTDIIDCWCHIFTEKIFKFTRRLLHSGTQIFSNILHSQDDINPHDQEDEGDKLAGDADTAVLKAKTGSQVKMRREWFIWPCSKCR